jgi:hypothetical protein
MQIDAPTWQNVSGASFQAHCLVYRENTALVDFVANYFSLSDERQTNCDERPRAYNSINELSSFHLVHEPCQKKV